MPFDGIFCSVFIYHQTIDTMKKMCLQKIHYLVIRALKQLIYNNVAIITMEIQRIKKNATSKIYGVLL
jgi:type III secretory pathway lipoprotein EscJ